MTRLILGRIGGALLVIWAAYTLTFFILNVLPGDPIQLMLDPTGTAPLDPDKVAAARAKYGFDQPVLVQYGTRLLGLLQGDLGQSLSAHKPVAAAIAQVFPNTLALAAFAIVVAVVLGAALAIGTADARSARLRAWLSELPPVVISLPTFWVGLVLIQVFAFQLGLLPAIGAKGFASLILPGITLALPAAALIAQVFARSIDQTLRREYVDLARLKGLSRSRVLWVHVLRNAVIPVLTLTGVIVGGLFAGAVVVETVFGRAGIGRLTEQAVTAHDIPLVQGLVLVASATFVVANLVVDLVVLRIDPRQTNPRRQRSLRSSVLREVGA